MSVLFRVRSGKSVAALPFHAVVRYSRSSALDTLRDRRNVLLAHHCLPIHGPQRIRVMQPWTTDLRGRSLAEYHQVYSAGIYKSTSLCKLSGLVLVSGRIPLRKSLSTNITRRRRYPVHFLSKTPIVPKTKISKSWISVASSARLFWNPSYSYPTPFEQTATLRMAVSHIQPKPSVRSMALSRRASDHANPMDGASTATRL